MFALSRALESLHNHHCRIWTANLLAVSSRQSMQSNLIGTMSELSVELIAHVLYYVPVSESKLKMQLISKRFRQAMALPEAHSITANAEYPLKASIPPGTSRSVLSVMPSISLRSGDRDFSWVAFLGNLQILACGYGALRPVSPIKTVRELILDCGTGRQTSGGWQASLYSREISLATLFPNVKKLNVNGIPEETETYKFLEDIQRMKLDIFHQVNYPFLGIPMLNENQVTNWNQWSLAVKPAAWDLAWVSPEDDLFEDISQFSASLLTAFRVSIGRVNDNFEIDLSRFCDCVKLQRLEFELEDPSNTILVVNADKLPQSCTLVQFANFAPFIQGVDGWRWEDSQSGLCRNICRSCQTIC